MPPTPDYEEIAALVRRCQAKDEEAFRRLLELHREVVTSTLLACGVRCRETARDLAQDTALKAWLRLDDLNDPRAFPAWIRRIAANAARDHLRRLAIRREEALDVALELVASGSLEDQVDRVSELRLMLSVLEPEDREVVELLEARADGVPVGDLARRVGLSEGALKMRLMRVRKRLRRRLEKLQATEAQRTTRALR